MKQRDIKLGLCCLLVSLPAFAAARLLIALINFFTGLFYHGHFSIQAAEPQTLFWPVALAIPVLGGLLVGLMARFGSKAIRGHGIPEAMDQVLTNNSRIPARLVWLKPLSAAIAIGSGGPFGAEGPIIATGGALGSLFGQWLPVHDRERKILLAAGAAAGMASIFGTPISAVLLALELLLFEFSPSAVFSVGLASAMGAGLRAALLRGSAPFFQMPMLETPKLVALVAYAVMGILFGLAAILAIRVVYGIEEAFERLPLHWMWWPALGGLGVGLIGLLEPRSLGVGYGNISDALSGNLTGTVLIFLVIMKFLSWSIALSSGTSGGTMAPLFTVGAGLGYLLGAWLNSAWPQLGLDPRLSALLGMAAVFAGASGAVLASIVLAFETTHQVPGVLPLLASCLLASATVRLLSPHSIMTARLAQRGVTVPHSWGAPIHEKKRP
jgi:H+/Cl- antiporter ClcA